MRSAQRTLCVSISWRRAAAVSMGLFGGGRPVGRRWLVVLVVRCLPVRLKSKAQAIPRALKPSPKVGPAVPETDDMSSLPHMRSVGRPQYCRTSQGRLRALFDVVRSDSRNDVASRNMIIMHGRYQSNIFSSCYRASLACEHLVMDV